MSRKLRCLDPLAHLASRIVGAARSGKKGWMQSHDTWLAQRIIPWAEADPNIRGLAEVGSRAHDGPADEWADMDLIVLAEDVSRIVDDDAWIHEIGPHWVAVRHPGPFPDLPVRQVLFEGALDFDVIPMRAGRLSEMLDTPHIARLVGEGFSPIVDKDGEIAAAALTEPTVFTVLGIQRDEFDFVVGDFLFQTVWAAKHLRRGELWAAKDDVDGYMKADLVRMVEWHATSHRPGTPVRGGGRFLERWADPRFLEAAPATFAVYEPAAVAAALSNMIEVFRWLGVETATRLGFNYPAQDHDAVAEWVRDCLSVIA